MSRGWITVILVVIALLNIASNIVCLAAITRDLYVFARDRGLPFSNWSSTVHPIRKIPVNACILTCVISSLLSLMYIGSPVASYAITSSLTSALLQSYCFSIGSVLYRRIKHPESLPQSHFSLGRWGIPVNALAVLCSFYWFFWTFWPQYYTVTASEFNWSSPVFAIVLIVAESLETKK